MNFLVVLTYLSAIGILNVAADGAITCIKSSITADSERDKIEIDQNVFIKVAPFTDLQVTQLCDDFNRKISLNSSIFILTLQNQSFKNDKLLSSICTNGRRGVLRTMKLVDYVNRVSKMLIIDKPPIVFNIQYITPMDDIIDAIKLENATVTEVLVEILPVSYIMKETSFVTPKSTKITNQVILGKLQLNNYNMTSMSTFGQMEYNYKETIRSSFLNKNGVVGLPVQIPNPDNTLIICNFDQDRSYIVDKIYQYSETIPTGTKVNITLYGQWSFEEYEVEGKLLPIYPVGWSDFKDVIVEKTRIQITEIHITNLHHNTTITSIADELAEQFSLRATTNALYPGFRPYFILACLLFFGVLTFALYDVISQVLKERQNKIF